VEDLLGGGEVEVGWWVRLATGVGGVWWWLVVVVGGGGCRRNFSWLVGVRDDNTVEAHSHQVWARHTMLDPVAMHLHSNGQQAVAN